MSIEVEMARLGGTSRRAVARRTGLFGGRAKRGRWLVRVVERMTAKKR